MEYDNLEFPDTDLQTSERSDFQTDEYETVYEYTLPSSPTWTEKSLRTCSTLSKRTSKISSTPKRKTLKKQARALSSVGTHQMNSSKSDSYKGSSKVKIESIYNLRSCVRNPVTGILSEVVAEKPKLDGLAGSKDKSEAAPIHSGNKIVQNAKSTVGHSNILKTTKSFPQIETNPVTGTPSEVVAERPKLDELAKSNDKSEAEVIHSGNNLAQDDKSAIGHSNPEFLKITKSLPRIRRNPITGEGFETQSHQANNFLRSGIRIKQPPGGESSGIF